MLKSLKSFKSQFENLQFENDEKKLFLSEMGLEEPGLDA